MPSSLLESEGKTGGVQGSGTGKERKPMKGMRSSQLPCVTSAQSCGGNSQKCQKPKPKLNPNKKASQLQVRPFIGLGSWGIYTLTLRHSLTEDSQGCSWAALGFWGFGKSPRQREAGTDGGSPKWESLRAEGRAPAVISWRLP